MNKTRVKIYLRGREKWHRKELSNKEKHYLLWDYLVKTGGASKHNAIDFLFGAEEARNMEQYGHCYACLVSSMTAGKDVVDASPLVLRCVRYCPLKFDRICADDFSWFQLWQKESDIDRRIFFATCIRDTKWEETE